MTDPTAMPDTTETEFKLRADHPLEVALVDAAVREMGLFCRAATSGGHVDTYLDDSLGSLARAGIGLRQRRGPRGTVVSCKGPAQIVNGLFIRAEAEEPWESGALPTRAAELPPSIRDEIEPFVLSRPLASFLVLTTWREGRMLQQNGQDLCELVIDRVEAQRDDRTAAFHEVELEVADDVAATERVALDLQQRLPLRPAADDKARHAATLLGIAGQAPPLPCDADSALGETVVQLARSHFDAMRAAEPGVRAGRDPEHVHAMRVAVRALRSLVRAFRDLWPSEVASHVLDRLGDTGRQLGAVRDHDVWRAALAKDAERLPMTMQPQGRFALTWLEESRRKASSALQTWLRSDARLHDLQAVEQALGEIDRSNPVALLRTGDAVPERIARAVARVRKLLAELPAELPLPPVHELRIATKRLRYLAAAFRTLPGHDYDKSLAALVNLQQALGGVCDRDLAVQRITTWIEPVAAAPDGGVMAAAALGAFAALQARGAEKARAKATRVLGRIDRKRTWRRFPGVESPDATPTA